jgi:DNA/RNA-binding domain of Phe-tRNA-synthetase-like protein
MMGDLTFTIAEGIVDRHPDILVGGLLASGLRGAAATVAGQPLPSDTAQALVNQDVTIELVADHPLIRDWRTAIASCGLKPSTFKPGPEQRARRALKGDLVPTPLALVDLYGEVASRHLAPLGGYDVARLPSTDLALRLADPVADTFLPVGARVGELALTERIAVYASGTTVLCWAYNCRDSRQTCFTPETDVGLFLGEAVTARQHDALRTALDDLTGRLGAAGATVGPVVYADRDEPTLAFSPEHLT